jgi:hypothetical protein
MEYWLFGAFAIIAIVIVIYNIVESVRSGGKRYNLPKYSNELPPGRTGWLSEQESRQLKAEQEKASTMAKKPLVSKLPSEFYRVILLPKNRIKCPRCGMGYKIYVLYGGDNTRYGCDWCGLVFT